jgi:hypothetical protein
MLLASWFVLFCAQCNNTLSVLENMLQEVHALQGNKHQVLLVLHMAQQTCLLPMSQHPPRLTLRECRGAIHHATISQEALCACCKRWAVVAADDGGICLAAALASNSHLRHLHLHHNQLGEPAAQALVRVLQRNKRLTTVTVMPSNANMPLQLGMLVQRMALGNKG